MGVVKRVEITISGEAWQWDGNIEEAPEWVKALVDNWPQPPGIFVQLPVQNEKRLLLTFGVKKTVVIKPGMWIIKLDNGEIAYGNEDLSNISGG